MGLQEALLILIVTLILVVIAIGVIMIQYRGFLVIWGLGFYRLSSLSCRLTPGRQTFTHYGYRASYIYTAAILLARFLEEIEPEGTCFCAV